MGKSADSPIFITYLRRHEGNSLCNGKVRFLGAYPQNLYAHEQMCEVNTAAGEHDQQQQNHMNIDDLKT